MIKLLTPPEIEPVTLEDMRLWLRIDDDQSEEDAMIASLLSSAREWVEDYINKTLITSAYEEYYSTSELVYRLQRGPVQEVTEVAAWYEPEGRYVAVLSDYIRQSTVQVDNIITINQNAEFVQNGNALKLKWSDVKDGHNVIKITYTTGYGDTADTVPGPILDAIKLRAASLYVNRADMANRYLSASTALLRNYKSEYARV